MDSKIGSLSYNFIRWPVCSTSSANVARSTVKCSRLNWSSERRSNAARRSSCSDGIVCSWTSTSKYPSLHAEQQEVRLVQAQGGQRHQQVHQGGEHHAYHPQEKLILLTTTRPHP